MFSKPLLRFVHDEKRIKFMRGRHAGLAVSAFLSALSIVLFFHPGLRLGLDFKGGVVVEAQTPGKANLGHLREILAQHGLSPAGIQKFGSDSDILLQFDIPQKGKSQEAATQALVGNVRQAVVEAQAGTQIVRADAVGASISKELFRNGILALVLSLIMILIYIWVRFEWEFAVSAVITLVLDLTKTIGFLAITRIQFDLVMVAAILTILGYSTNDKVVVYDRVRENLLRYRTMKLRDLLDLSINETLNRTLGTSMTVFLAALPLAVFGGSSLSGFATVMLFGIIVGTSSSIFIAAPLLLLFSKRRLENRR